MACSLRVTRTAVIRVRDERSRERKTTDQGEGDESDTKPHGYLVRQDRLSTQQASKRKARLGAGLAQ